MFGIGCWLFFFLVSICSSYLVDFYTFFLYARISFTCFPLFIKLGCAVFIFLVSFSVCVCFRRVALLLVLFLNDKVSHKSAQLTVVHRNNLQWQPRTATDTEPARSTHARNSEVTCRNIGKQLLFFLCVLIFSPPVRA